MTHIRICACCLLAVVWGAAPGPAQEANGPNDRALAAVRSALDQVIQKVPRASELGLVVADADSGKRWFEHHGRTPLKPASVQKLFVTSAALLHWGPEFELRTQVYLHDGELWVLGGGDPGLGDERIAGKYGRRPNDVFELWAEALQRRGVDRLTKLVIDDGIFDQQWRHPDWPEDQSNAWYQAPVGGVNFNDNCLDSRVQVLDGAVELLLTPPLPAAFIRNELTVGRKQAPIVHRRPDSDVFEFSGTVARDGALGPVSARRPAVFFGYALQSALAARGITVEQGVVRRAIAPEMLASAQRVAVHGTPLADILWRCNTHSQNLFAECLVKALGAFDANGEPTGRPGSWEAGIRTMATTLAGAGVDVDDARFRDGSGLSHENRVTAAQIVDLLVAMRGRPVGALLHDSLAEPGEDGSMRRRHADSTLVGRLRAKTGTIRGVRSLAGYVEREDGVTLAFAALLNGDNSTTLLTRVCKALVAPAGE